MPLVKNQTYIAEITGYSSSGAGVCRIEGRAVFVEQAMLGETWEILILKVTQTAVFGKGLFLILPSPDRIPPSCPVFGKCGGCDLLHMSYDHELAFKLARVNDAFEHIGRLDFSIDEIIPADSQERYRNKAIFNIAADTAEEAKEKTCFGFYRRRSHEQVSVTDCQIQSELSVRAACAVCDFMAARDIPAYDETTGKGLIRHLFLRNAVYGSDAVAVVVTAGGLGRNTQALADHLRAACPELTGIVLCVNKSAGNTVLDGQYHTLWGQAYIQDKLCGLTFRISPGSFYQVNPVQAELLYKRALEYASPDGDATVLDLYCGAGTISLCLAKGARKVYGAEIVESAVRNARENALENGITNAEFILGDASDAAKQLACAGVSPTAVVLDPPRKGLTARLIDTVAEMSPERVVYVSCDPGTLARDLKLFSEKGYRPTAGTAVDMFPRTCHVETCVLLSHKNS